MKEGLSEIDKNITSLDEELDKTLDNSNQKLEDPNEKGERTKEIKNDSKPERKEIPNNKTMEPVIVFPEKKANGNKENTKDKEVEPKKRRSTHSRKLMRTKEEMEMMNHGLFDNDNILITNNEEIVSSRNYGSRLRVISEVVYQQTVVYHWEVIRGKWNTTGCLLYTSHH